MPFRLYFIYSYIYSLFSFLFSEFQKAFDFRIVEQTREWGREGEESRIFLPPNMQELFLITGNFSARGDEGGGI